MPPNVQETVTLLIAVSVAIQQSPGAMLQRVAAGYQRLESVSLSIDREDGANQVLKWARPSRFELLATKQPEGSKLPDWLCDGQQVTTRWSDRVDRKERSNAKDSIPAYELSAGPILSWLLRSDFGDRWLKSEKGSKIDYSWGPKIDYHGSAVREVDVSIDERAPARFFVSVDGKRLIGFESGKQWRFYRDQADNIILMPSLGSYRG